MSIPSESRLDHSVALLREGYAFAPNRFRRYSSDLFQTRLTLKPVVCITGAEAAREFYADGRFVRQGALPPTALTLLQDKGSVALKTGEAHRSRKEMFLSFMRPGNFDELVALTRAEWLAAAERWTRRTTVVVHEQAQEVLCRAVCSWAGVPLPEEDVRQRTRELGAMIDGAGSVGPRQWRGQLLRTRTERWLRTLVTDVRQGRIQAPEGSATAVIASHRGPDGELLDVAVAAVELLNVLRPTVAVARFVTFAVLALHKHPETRRAVAEGGDTERHAFVQEVRRLAPFFPFVGGRVAVPFTWRDHHFAEHDWVLLDIYGTNRDTAAWDQPGAFRPDRFRDWAGDAFTPIPQGGGEHLTGHRCPGEWITIELTKVAVDVLTSAVTYDVPQQDLSVSLSRIPATPASGMIIAGVRVGT